MRNVFLLAAVVVVAGCATMTYTSNRPASDVAECLASGWRKSPHSGYEAPVSLSKTEGYYFVGVELHPTFPSPVVTGTKHPFHAVWAEVSDSPSGSIIEYHRSYQVMHDVIDGVVVECQGPE